MTPRERLLKVLAGEIPDCVPVAPDISNMIPARLTGKPFWDLYLYNDPPILGGVHSSCEVLRYKFIDWTLIPRLSSLMTTKTNRIGKLSLSIVMKIE